MTDPHRYLLGRIAVEHGLLTEEQLQKCIEIQRSSGNPTRLGQVLLDLGYVNRHQLRFIEAKQGQRMEETDVFQNRPAREVLFGKLVVQLGYCREHHVNECLRESALREADGQEVRLGELMVARGYLSPYQLNAVLAEQNKKILYCTTCDKHFNVLGFRRGFRLRCLHCETTLVAPRERFATAATEELFFDEERAENVALLGQVAIRNGILQQAQIEEALDVQETKFPEKSLGQILVELGSLTPASLDGLLRLQSQTAERKRQVTLRISRETRFGTLAIREGLASEDMVNRSLAVQAKEESEGRRRRIATILVESHFLTLAQAAHLLELQGRRIGRCTACARQYNLVGYAGRAAHCPTCQAEVALVAQPESLDVADDLHVAEAKLAVVELDAHGGPEPSPEIRSTQRNFRKFYQREKLAEPSPGAPATTAAPTLVPLDVERRIRQTKRAQAAVARHRWLIPVIGGSVLAVAALVSAIGFLVTREDRAARPDATDPLGPPPSSDPVEGDQVVAIGVIPPGGLGRIAILERETQVFLLVVQTGEAYWVVDEKGESYERLQFLSRPAGAAAAKPVQVRGTYRTAPPPSPVLPVVSVRGYIVVEAWAPVPGGRLPQAGGNLQVLPR